MRASAEITYIDHKTTVRKLLPLIKSRAAEYLPEFAAKLIAELDVSAAETVILGVLDRLGENERFQVICGTVNKYSSVITEKVNSVLEKRLPQVKIGSIGAGSKNGGMYIYADNADVDLEALMNDPAVAELVERKAKELITSKLGNLAGALLGRGAAGLIKGLVATNPEEAKTIAVQVLNSGKYTAKIAETVEEAISEWTVISLGELKIYDDSAEEKLLLPTMPDMRTAYWSDKLISAIAGYINDNTPRT